MKSLRKVSFILLLGIFLATPAVAFAGRQQIFDWFRLRNYTPPAQVAQLATSTTMNPATRQEFYVYHPQLEDKTTFSGHCSESEHTIVLGCYISREGIYIYDVKDQRLDGVQQVTAAHELLHAAYERLSAPEKQQVNKLLLEAYGQVTDKRIRDNINSYRQAGADTTNELHSILGTEVRNLPPELETYYKRYFTDRSKIVAYSEKYQQVFDDRKAKVDADDAELKALKTQIDNLEKTLENESSALSSERNRMDSLKASKQIDDYNQAVDPYNSRVSTYNHNVVLVGTQIDRYNKLLIERNSIATEENDLIKAIDSRPNTVPSK